MSDEGGAIPNLHLETPTVTLEQRYEGTNVTEEDIERQNAFESGIVGDWAETVLEKLTVSSKAFFEVIKENIDEFEMSTKDAVLDAIEQLKAQGVDERVLRHYLQHDMSAYKDLDLGTDAATGEEDSAETSDTPEAADTVDGDDAN
eukprot:INCI3629.1.p1 GENE.INCI3629.1~~INCI3629.1.p1  ORF type:complete len:146 (+),score=41.28 INCI3629.1:138-575(+)